MRLRTVVCLLAALSLAYRAAPAEDWPNWRGPDRTGVSPETGLPTRWSAGELAWNVELAGSGVSSPVVAGVQVVVTSQYGFGSRKPGRHPLLARTDPAVAESERALVNAPSEDPVVFVVEAFHTGDGRRLWEYRLPADGELPRVHDKHNLASPSTVIDERGVYAWFGTGQLVALNLAGELIWQRHLGREIAPFEIDWGHGSSPAAHGELLFLLCYHDHVSYLLAIDKGSGETRWRVDRAAQVRSYSTPLVIQGPENEELIINSTEGVHAYAPETGDLLWYIAREHRFGVGMPSFHDGIVYASRGYRSGPYMAIRPGGSGDVSATHIAWRVPTGAPYVSSLLHYRGLIYMGSDTGVVTCVDAASGEKLWQHRTGGIFSASPVAGDGKVYFMSESGETTVFEAGREPRVLARNQIDGHVVASPAIAGGRIFVRTDDRLIAIGGT